MPAWFVARTLCAVVFATAILVGCGKKIGLLGVRAVRVWLKITSSVGTSGASPSR